MSEPLLDVKNISLEVPIIRPDDRKLMNNPIKFLADLYLSRTRRGMVKILDDISFSLSPGERIGLIGANGAGKSTLLRVLAGIYTPTAGTLIMKGSAKGLFDISLGMNYEATGLENIYIRGLQMGMDLEKTKKLVPQVVAFSELEDYLDQPFNTYSAGMRLRLAVSISTMIEPDILLLDEWIGTGDAKFREKVKTRMHSLIEQSRGLILASHSNSLLRNLCSHGLVLSKGKVVYYGALEEALEYYQKNTKNLSKRTNSTCA